MLHIIKWLGLRFRGNSNSPTVSDKPKIKDKTSAALTVPNACLLPKYLNQYGSFVFFALALGFQMTDVPNLFAQGYERKTKIDRSAFQRNIEKAEKKISDARRKRVAAEEKIRKADEKIQKLRNKWYGILKEKGYADAQIQRFLDKNFPFN